MVTIILTTIRVIRKSLKIMSHRQCLNHLLPPSSSLNNSACSSRRQFTWAPLSKTYFWWIPPNRIPGRNNKLKLNKTEFVEHCLPSTHCRTHQTSRKSFTTLISWLEKKPAPLRGPLRVPFFFVTRSLMFSKIAWPYCSAIYTAHCCHRSYFNMKQPIQDKRASKINKQSNLNNRSTFEPSFERKGAVST